MTKNAVNGRLRRLREAGRVERVGPRPPYRWFRAGQSEEEEAEPSEDQPRCPECGCGSEPDELDPYCRECRGKETGREP